MPCCTASFLFIAEFASETIFSPTLTSSVREGCRIGRRVILQNGAVIGADGFGFAREADGRWHKILPIGISVLGDDVEIQANSCVDRATMGETRVDANVKVDDLVLVGHGTTVGEGTVISAQAGFAGTTEIGKNCMIGGQVGASGHLTIGDGAMITPQSGVHNDIPAGELYSGSPAVPHKQWLKNSAAINHVTDLLKTVRRLEAEIERPQGQIENLSGAANRRQRLLLGRQCGGNCEVNALSQFPALIH